ncbi:MAG: hypothetical protein ACT4OP_06515 [Actinomycetota bacterium]
MDYADVEPVPGPEAFEEATSAGQLSQAAVLLSAGAAVRGREEQVPRASEFPLPELRALRGERRLTVEQATRYLEIGPRIHAQQFIPQVALDQAPRLAHELYDHPDPAVAASLIEASLHSPHEVVRVAAAVAALDTTRSRGKLRQILEQGAVSLDELTRELAATGLARVDPTNRALGSLVGEGVELKKSDRPSRTAALTHGTWGSAQAWYQPGGDFYSYLAGLNPPLHLHPTSFQWSGAYSHDRRRLAAQELKAWVGAQQLTHPDFFAHSHGATVGNLATRDGLVLDRLVLLAWPVHPEWFPDFSRVGRVIDVRVRFDLVILADRGGQRFPAGSPVEEHIHGWFSHPAPHEPAYWATHGLAAVL